MLKKMFDSLSMVKFEYIVVIMDSYEVAWLKKLFGDQFEQVLDTTTMYCDNKSGF